MLIQINSFKNCLFNTILQKNSLSSRFIWWYLSPQVWQWLTSRVFSRWYVNIKTHGPKIKVNHFFLRSFFLHKIHGQSVSGRYFYLKKITIGMHLCLEFKMFKPTNQTQISWMRTLKSYIDRKWQWKLSVQKWRH